MNTFRAQRPLWGTLRQVLPFLTMEVGVAVPVSFSVIFSRDEDILNEPERVPTVSGPPRERGLLPPGPCGRRWASARRRGEGPVGGERWPLACSARPPPRGPGGGGRGPGPSCQDSQRGLVESSCSSLLGAVRASVAATLRAARLCARLSPGGLCSLSQKDGPDASCAFSAPAPGPAPDPFQQAAVRSQDREPDVRAAVRRCCSRARTAGGGRAARCAHAHRHVCVCFCICVCGTP